MSKAWGGKGATLVEAAIVLPILLLFILVTLDFGFYFFAKNSADRTAKMAAALATTIKDLETAPNDTSASSDEKNPIYQIKQRAKNFSHLFVSAGLLEIEEPIFVTPDGRTIPLPGAYKDKPFGIRIKFRYRGLTPIASNEYEAVVFAHRESQENSPLSIPVDCKGNQLLDGQLPDLSKCPCKNSNDPLSSTDPNDPTKCICPDGLSAEGRQCPACPITSRFDYDTRKCLCLPCAINGQDHMNPNDCNSCACPGEATTIIENSCSCPLGMLKTIDPNTGEIKCNCSKELCGNNPNVITSDDNGICSCKCAIQAKQEYIEETKTCQCTQEIVNECIQSEGYLNENCDCITCKGKADLNPEKNKCVCDAAALTSFCSSNTPPLEANTDPNVCDCKPECDGPRTECTCKAGLAEECSAAGLTVDPLNCKCAGECEFDDRLKDGSCICDRDQLREECASKGALPDPIYCTCMCPDPKPAQGCKCDAGYMTKWCAEKFKLPFGKLWNNGNGPCACDEGQCGPGTELINGQCVCSRAFIEEMRAKGFGVHLEGLSCIVDPTPCNGAGGMEVIGDDGICRCDLISNGQFNTSRVNQFINYCKDSYNAPISFSSLFGGRCRCQTECLDPKELIPAPLLPGVDYLQCGCSPADREACTNTPAGTFNEQTCLCDICPVGMIKDPVTAGKCICNPNLCDNVANVAPGQIKVTQIGETCACVCREGFYSTNTCGVGPKCSPNICAGGNCQCTPDGLAPTAG